MRIEELVIFLSIAKNKSISKAAQELHFSQPAITSTLNSLEKQLGVTLVNRHERQKQPLELTSKGLILKDYADRIVNEYNDLQMKMLYEQLSPSPPIVVSGGRSLCTFIIPSTVNLFSKIYPNVQIGIKSFIDTQNSIDSLLRGKCDFVFSSIDFNIPDLVFDKLMSDSFVFACPLETNIPDVISPKHLLKLPFVMREESCITYELISKALKKLKIDIHDLNIVMTQHDNTVIQQSIEMGIGCGFIPRSFIYNQKHHTRNLRIVSIKGWEDDRYVYLVRRKEKKMDDSYKLFYNYMLSDQWYNAVFPGIPR